MKRKALIRKLQSARGVSRLVALLAAAVLVLAVMALLPAVRRYTDRGASLGCELALSTANDDLRIAQIERGSLSAAEIAEVVPDWEQLCPSGGEIRVVWSAGGVPTLECSLHHD